MLRQADTYSWDSTSSRALSPFDRAMLRKDTFTPFPDTSDTSGIIVDFATDFALPTAQTSLVGAPVVVRALWPRWMRRHHLHWFAVGRPGTHRLADCCHIGKNVSVSLIYAYTVTLQCLVVAEFGPRPAEALGITLPYGTLYDTVNSILSISSPREKMEKV